MSYYRAGGEMCDVALFNAVDKFYDDEQNFMMIYRVLHKVPNVKRKRNRAEMQNKKPQLTLKLIHYAVTSYLANGAIIGLNGKPVSITSIYAAGIAAHGRQNYDAFRRCNSFMYEKHGLVVKTALAQLVFFRDLIRYNILQYVFDHIPEIYQCMRKNEQHRSIASVMCYNMPLSLI